MSINYAQFLPTMSELDAMGGEKAMEKLKLDLRIQQLEEDYGVPDPHVAIRAEIVELRARLEVLEARDAAAVASATPATPPPDPGARSITAEQAAHRLGCGRWQVFTLLRKGKLSRGKKAGRATMVTVASVERLEGVRRGT